MTTQYSPCIYIECLDSVPGFTKHSSLKGLVLSLMRVPNLRMNIVGTTDRVGNSWGVLCTTEFPMQGFCDDSVVRVLERPIDVSECQFEQLEEVFLLISCPTNRCTASCPILRGGLDELLF
jgi:hypothetical protein